MSDFIKRYEQDLLEWYEALVFALFVFVIGFSFLFRIIVVNGMSMVPTLSPGDRLIGYGEAYQRLRMDAHLVTCDTTGALQLAIMARPDYRRRLTRLAVQSKFVPPPEDFPGCDAFYEGAPFLLAADMDLRRIDAAIQTAYERGCYPVVLAALAGQAEAVLYARYRDTGKARVFRLTDSALREFFGTDSPLYAPSHQQFLTAKGEAIGAPLIQAHRKT